jgi:hypothetical protein
MKLIKNFPCKKSFYVLQRQGYFLFLSKVGTGTVTFQKSEPEPVKNSYGSTTLSADRPSGEGGR